MSLMFPLNLLYLTIYMDFSLLVLNTPDDAICDKLEGPFNRTWQSPTWKGSGWYRFTGKAGTMMPEKSPGTDHCGTGAPGWVNGRHPATPGEEIQVQICFEWGIICWRSTNATIRNCGNYFLYNLPETPDCDSAYCGSVGN